MSAIAKAIRCNGAQVRAIHDGRMTTERRPMKVQPLASNLHKYGVGKQYSPPHKPGDRLWLREKARLIEVRSGECEDSGLWRINAHVRLRYESDGAESDWLPYPDRLKLLAVGQCVPNGCYREAARTYLDVIKVRAERVQDITEADAIAEGMPWSDYREMDMDLGIPQRLVVRARDEFRHVWTSIYGPDAWDRNDWVWVTEFKRVTP